MEGEHGSIGKQGWGLSRRSRVGKPGVLVMMGMMVLSWAWAARAQSSALPDCAATLGDRPVVNAEILDAMIAQAEPGGARPDRAQARLLIVVRHYLARYKGLLVLQRPVTEGSLLLLQQDCLPFPESAQQARAPFDALTTDERQTLLTYYDLASPTAPRAPAPVTTGDTVRLPGGKVRSPSGKTAKVEAFTIDARVVTNAAFQQFIQAQGYSTETYWSAEGWGWRKDKGQLQPSYWEDKAFNTPEQPVVGVTWYEADAYCRWAGKALPSETQWDKACQSAADQRNGTPDFSQGLLEWTSSAHGTQGLGLRSRVKAAGDPQAACGSSHVLLPGVAANFIGFRCQGEAQ